jgi:carboxyl-terminal processing protease
MLTKIKILQVLALELALFLPGVPLTSPVQKGSKPIEQYWAETDLRGNELDELLQSSTCHHDQISFLACANAVTQVAEKYALEVEPSGEIHPLQKRDVQLRLTEKAALQIWKKAFEQTEFRPSFIEIWKTLQAKIHQPQHLAYQVALGMNAYLSVAKDPHSYIIPLAYYEEVVANSDSRQLNLGFIIRRNREAAVVRKVFEGSPAQVAGIRKGDQVLEINGIPVGEMLPSAFAEALRAANETRLVLKVERWDKDQREEKIVDILRSEFVNPSVTAQLLEHQGPTRSSRIGLLSINKFAHETCDLAKKRLIGLKEQGIQGLLIDLRDNPGGQVEEAACVVNLFVKKNRLLFETRYLEPGRPKDEYISQEDPIYLGSLAVLINSGSASASEIVAGSLKDLGRATLVGEKSFGKGSFQDGRLWESHGKIAVFETEGLYYFPSGWTPQVVGIEPDIQVDFNDMSMHREAELYFNPIVPKDIWSGPQSLTFLQMMQCQEDHLLWQDFGTHYGDDTQLLKAKEWILCQRQAGATP